MLDRRPANLSLTIAGGPPSAMHNYRAKISLPIIGRNLRAWFIAESELKDDLVTKSSFGVCKNPEFLAGENTEEGTSLSTLEVITEAQMENSQAEAQVSGNTTEMTDNAGNVDKVDPAVKDHCKDKVRNDFGSSGKDSVTSRVGESGESRVMFEGNNFTQGGEQGNGNDVIMAGHYPCHLIQNQVGNKAMRMMLLWLECVLLFMTFQLVEVDDPVASMQKLFTSPLAKRRKLVRPS